MTLRLRDALEARAAVVAVTAQDAAERLLGGAEARPAAVVLEAREHRPSSSSIATLPISRGPSSRTV